MTKFYRFGFVLTGILAIIGIAMLILAADGGIELVGGDAYNMQMTYTLATFWMIASLVVAVISVGSLIACTISDKSFAITEKDTTNNEKPISDKTRTNNDAIIDKPDNSKQEEKKEQQSKANFEINEENILTCLKCGATQKARRNVCVRCGEVFKSASETNGII